MEEAARGVLSFDIVVSGLGVFPNLQRVQIIWVGLSGKLDKLGQLQQRIETGLTPLGFKTGSSLLYPPPYPGEGEG